ncbi:MAG: diguanylate cyclase [Rhodocyclaceae bacterium]|jgi:diguanylate cyclase (GGDEF)-like protein|nr:diguanylate cyclase [Rhodocyclaceae bacterium]MCL4756711.1 diguanylate cyclase [Rhodocyclaceae bacterium]
MHPQATILVVDDAPENLRVMTSVLKDHYKVKVATSGERALAVAGGAERPDLILLDVVMPGMDGYEVCERLKADPDTAEIPVIFVTSRDDEEDEEHGLAAGAIDYIVKPIRPSIVQARVRNHIELKRSRDLLQRLTTVDHLTGIHNRRRFDEYLDIEWRRAARDRDPVALIAIDIDHFKAYNDHYGHPRGDECLVAVARTLFDVAARPTDLVARCGGEEFACVLPATDIESALELAERMLARVRALDLPHAASPLQGRVSVSMGVAAAVPQAGSSPEGLIELADKALYEAKASGRNRVIGWRGDAR